MSLKSKKKIYRKKSNLTYSAKKYSNPYFDKKQDGFLKKLSWKKKISILFVFVLFFSFLWFLFYSPYFGIKEISVEGEGRINEEDVKKDLENYLNRGFWFFSPKRNLILFDSENFKKEISKKYSFKNFEIKKDYPNELKIFYKEKDYAFVWEEGGERYFCSEDGEIISKNINKESPYPVFENLSNKLINNKYIGVDYAYIDYGLDLYERFKKLKDFKIEKIIINDNLNIKLLNGPVVYFDIKKGMNAQIEKLLKLKQEKLKDDFNNLEYVNVKIGNSVYYKMKSVKEDEKNNKSE